MPPFAPLSHRLLHVIKGALLASENEKVFWIRIGDSRSAWRHYRGHGEFYRQFDVKHAALLCPATPSNNGLQDGLGHFPGPITGLATNTAAPGSTLPGCGIFNTLPAFIAESWTTGDPNNPQFGQYSSTRSTAGGAMNSTNVLASTGGTFKRGDPSQGRNLQSIIRYAVTDSRPSTAWLPSIVDAGWNDISTGAFTPVTLPPPPSSSDSNLLITPQTVALGSTNGTRLHLRYRHTADPVGTNNGMVYAGTMITWGSVGVVYAQCADGGWQSTDHLSASAFGLANTDTKYTDAGLTAWLTKVLAVAGHRTVIEIDLGTNSPTIPGFGEWDGATANTYRRNVEGVVDRWAAAAVAAGAAAVHVLLSRPWQAPGDSARNNAYGAELLSLATARGWSYYDQEAELRGGGYSDGGVVGLAETYRETGDASHPNHDGINLLGSLKNAAIFEAKEPGGGGPFITRLSRAAGLTAPKVKKLDDEVRVT